MALRSGYTVPTWTSSLDSNNNKPCHRLSTHLASLLSLLRHDPVAD